MVSNCMNRPRCNISGLRGLNIFWKWLTSSDRLALLERRVWGRWTPSSFRAAGTSLPGSLRRRRLGLTEHRFWGRCTITIWIARKKLFMSPEVVPAWRKIFMVSQRLTPTSYCMERPETWNPVSWFYVVVNKLVVVILWFFAMYLVFSSEMSCKCYILPLSIANLYSRACLTRSS